MAAPGQQRQPFLQVVAASLTKPRFSILFVWLIAFAWERLLSSYREISAGAVAAAASAGGSASGTTAPAEPGSTLATSIFGTLKEELSLRVILGMVALGLAVWAWASTSAALSRLGPDQRFGITRHWGGLGSGEGGWEVEPLAIQWLMRVAGALAMSALAFVLLVPGLRTGDALAAQRSRAPAPSAPPAKAPASHAADAGPAVGAKGPDREAGSGQAQALEARTTGESGTRSVPASPQQRAQAPAGGN